MLKNHFEAQACNPAICIAGFFSEMNRSGDMLFFDRDLPMIFLKSILKKRVLGIKEKNNRSTHRFCGKIRIFYELLK